MFVEFIVELGAHDSPCLGIMQENLVERYTKINKQKTFVIKGEMHTY